MTATPVDGEPSEWALVLMREAQRVLEADQNQIAGSNLQIAIDQLQMSLEQRGYETGRRCSELAKADPDYRSVVRAVGGGFVLLASLFECRHPGSLDRLRQAFETYAIISAENDPDEGRMIGAWAAMLADVAEGDMASIAKHADGRPRSST